MSKRIVVTGATGYIGSVLVPELVGRGHDVVGIDSGFFDDTLVSESLRDTSWSLIRADVRNVTADVFEGVDAVIHLAGLSNDPLGDISPTLTESINEGGTRAVALAAKAAGVGHFIFASSCSVYGSGTGDQVLVEDDEASPVTQYAVSKLRSETFLATLEDDTFRATSFRAATVFGFSPRIRIDLVINELTAQAVTGRPITLKSTGNAWRPFIHIKDLAKAYSTVVEADPAAFEHTIYNVGAEATTSRIIDVANIVSEATGVEVVIEDGASPDLRNYRVDFSRFAKDFPEWEADYTTHSGIVDIATMLTQYGFTSDDLTGTKFRRLPKIMEQIDAGVLDADLFHVSGARA